MDTAPPDHLKCPITMELFNDPVMTMDGQTYERAMVTAWLNLHDTSPTTGLVFADRSVRPNVQLKHAVEAWAASQSLSIEPSRVTINESALLGRGSYGAVFEGTLDGKPVAVKTYETGGDARNLFDKELVPHRRAVLSCNHVVRLYGHTTKGSRLCLVMKRYRKSLMQHLRAAGSLSVGESLHLGQLLFAAIAELEEAGIVSSDIKPENLLLDDNGHLFIADLGIATIVDRSVWRGTRTDCKGTLEYMPPEQFDKAKYGMLSGKTDVWAAACVMLHMLTGRAPFFSRNMAEIISAVSVRQDDPLSDLLGRDRTAADAHVPVTLREVLRVCFAIKQSERPSARQVCGMLATLLAAHGAPVEAAAGRDWRGRATPLLDERLQTALVQASEAQAGQQVLTAELAQLRAQHAAEVTRLRAQHAAEIAQLQHALKEAQTRSANPAAAVPLGGPHPKSGAGARDARPRLPAQLPAPQPPTPQQPAPQQPAPQQPAPQPLAPPLSAPQLPAAAQSTRPQPKKRPSQLPRQPTMPAAAAAPQPNDLSVALVALFAGGNTPRLSRQELLSPPSTQQPRQQKMQAAAAAPQPSELSALFADFFPGGSTSSLPPQPHFPSSWNKLQVVGANAQLNGRYDKKAALCADRPAYRQLDREGHEGYGHLYFDGRLWILAMVAEAAYLCNAPSSPFPPRNGWLMAGNLEPARLVISKFNSHH